MRFLFVLMMGILSALPVGAQSIVAIVNDMPISSYDVDQRARLIRLMQPDAPVDAVQKEALEQLVSDTLKIQEADKKQVKVSEEDIQQAVQRLENQNQMPAGQLNNELEKAGVSVSTLKKQLRADLMWLQVLRQHKNEVPEISDKMVQNRIQQMKRDLARESFLLAEILVKDQQTADAVVAKIRNGARFDEVAKEQSVAKTASKGGFLGWVAADQYVPEVVSVLRQMQPNQLADPIKMADGYRIFVLLDRKVPMPEHVTVWELAQLAVLPTQTIDVLGELSALTDCADFEKWGQQKALPDSAKRGFVNTQQLPSELVKMLENKKRNTLVGPVSMGQADLFFMKCQEQERSLIPETDEVRGQLEMEQMMMLTDRLLRQIKRYAVIEYKD